jgi:hypothetical protein
MEPNDLAFFTTQELIDELMRRKTFLGVVVHSEDDMRGVWRDGAKMFKVRFSDSLDASSASRLLDKIASHIDLQDG